MDTIKPTIGRIVEFFPGDKEVSNIELPNGMQSAPAVITQVFGDYCNLTVFVADPNGLPVMAAWSIYSNKPFSEGVAYWDWPKKV